MKKSKFLSAIAGIIIAFVLGIIYYLIAATLFVPSIDVLTISVFQNFFIGGPFSILITVGLIIGLITPLTKIIPKYPHKVSTHGDMSITISKVSSIISPILAFNMSNDHSAKNFILFLIITILLYGISPMIGETFSFIEKIREEKRC
jgi:hypothetical protein